MVVVRVENVSKEYVLGKQRVTALKDVTLSVAEGEFLAIAGPSGSGKSTLLNLLGGLALPSAGQILIDGADITKMDESQRAAFRLQTIGIIYQTDNLIPFLTALENVMLPLQLAGEKDAFSRAVVLLLPYFYGYSTTHPIGFII